ncbi:MAG: aldo/keto reductase, partial [Pseudomonadota bacterium]
RFNPRFEGENFTRNLELANKIHELASSKGCTPAQLALAWILAQGDDIVPIPGTRSATRLCENAAAADIALSPAELAAIEAAFPLDAAAGTRYPEASSALLNG